MGNPIVHFEIIGKNAPRLRNYYAELFDWTFDTSSPVASEVSEAGNYGFINLNTTPDGVGIPGGVGGGTRRARDGSREEPERQTGRSAFPRPRRKHYWTGRT